jgi:O-acetyl-ADP-ribose deacetylase (regulator of RNase III)
MPAISTGVYGYPPDEAVSIIVNSAATLKVSLTHVVEVRFVVRDTPMMMLFENAISRVK